ncbi:MAG: penicillin-binding protein 2 [Tepidibacillus sp.]|uniref:penicillin-binding protein 2 n=1 Tax=Tepidibacillus sp. HK-1 TaxID=1883407 RepID=UPI00085398EB|nr:penicillin-binding protein 2 [Tepidibacillus sp. HK-1]GBF09997.1 penicillin-binding protein 2B [Tepidibacillus sp. HK-1]
MKKKTKEKKPISLIRINILFFIVFLLFAVIIFRLSFVQLVEGAKYKALADTNRVKEIPFTAPRGLIMDANHEVLVNNKTVWTITFQINENQKQDYEQIAAYLADILVKPDEDKQKLKETILNDMDVGPFFRASKYIPRTIRVDIDEKTRAFIEEHKSELPGIEVIPDQMRNYINGDFMGHVLGYTRNIPSSELDYYLALGYKLNDRIGRYGLEKQYEEVLHGKDGEYVVEVNSDYETVEQKSFTNPVPGNNLILSIDKRFQDEVEKALEKQVNEIKNRPIKPAKDVEIATAVVMNPKTGAILAMGNYPRFDPNWYNGSISTELYKEKIMPYEANTAIRGRFPMGSTMKPLTVLMGLQEGVITPNTYIFDNGRIQYDKDPLGNPIYMRNAQGHAYGNLNPQTALQKSSNIFMTEVVMRMRAKYGLSKTMEKMRYYDQMFGLGSVNTGIDLPEELPGMIAMSSKTIKVNGKEKRTTFPNSNYVQQSIGQNDTFTPLQLAQYVSTIANGGYRMQPYLVQAIEEGTPSGTSGKILFKREPKVLNKVEISPENLKTVQEGMLLVTQPGGTAYSSLGNLPIRVAAKTGTAQSSDRRKEDNAVLIGYAPYEDPEIAFAIIVPHGGYGGSTAGPIAREIVKAYLEIYKNGSNPKQE